MFAASLWISLLVSSLLAKGVDHARPSAPRGVIGGRPVSSNPTLRKKFSGTAALRYQLNYTRANQNQETSVTLGDCSAGIFEGDCVVTSAHCFPSVPIQSYLPEDHSSWRVGVNLDPDGTPGSSLSIGYDETKYVRMHSETLPSGEFVQADLAVFRLRRRPEGTSFRLSQIPDESSLKPEDDVAIVGSGPDKLENKSGDEIILRKEEGGPDAEFKGFGTRRVIEAKVGTFEGEEVWLKARDVPPTATPAEKLRAKFWTGQGDSGGLVLSEGPKGLLVQGIVKRIDIEKGSSFLRLPPYKRWLEKQFKEMGCGSRVPLDPVATN